MKTQWATAQIGFATDNEDEETIEELFAALRDHVYAIADLPGTWFIFSMKCQNAN